MANNDGFINKAKYWECICYPENMIDNWQEDLPDIVQIPFAYCIHDKDADGHDGDRKVHVHLFLMFEHTNGNTTRKHAISVANLLSKPGRVCCPAAKAIINIEHAYEYLIHNTEAAKKAGKYEYQKSCRITGNGFDLARYIHISTEQKLEMAKELADFAIEKRCKDMRSLYVLVTKNFGNEYFEIFKSCNAMLDRLCRGNFNSMVRNITPINAPHCAICDSRETVGSFQTDRGRLWFCAQHQETAYRLAEEWDEYEKENAGEIEEE